MPLVLSSPCRQEVFYPASNSAGILLFLMCSDKKKQVFADETNDNKDLKLNASPSFLKAPA